MEFELIAKIEHMSDDVHRKICKLIDDDNIPYSCNKKYIFVDMSVIPQETIEKIMEVVNTTDLVCTEQCVKSHHMEVTHVQTTNACVYDTSMFESKTKKRTQVKKSFILSGKKNDQYDPQQNELDFERV